MIETAFALQVAVRDAVQNETVSDLAHRILGGYQNMTQVELSAVLFEMVAEVSSMSSFFTAEACLGEEGMEQLHSTIEMLQEMGNN
jgi:hypothetical protein